MSNVKQDDASLNKLNWKLVKDVFAMTKPYWVSSGPQQKWLLLYFLSFVGGFAAPILMAMYNFALGVGAQGEPLTLISLAPGAVTGFLAVAAVTAFFTGFRYPLVQRLKVPYIFAGIFLLVQFVANPAYWIVGVVPAWVYWGVGAASLVGYLAGKRNTARLSSFKYPLMGLSAIAISLGVIGSFADAYWLQVMGTVDGLVNWLAHLVTPANAEAHRITIVAVGSILALAVPTAYLMFTRKVMDKGWRLLGILISLMFSVNGLNVLLSFLHRDMWNNLQAKEVPEFYVALWTLGAVFILGIPIVVCYRWVRDKLGLAWREWLTTDLCARYLEDRNYYRIDQFRSVDNPDQRISEDPRYFTQGALAFLLLILDSILTVSLFVVVLYSISPILSGGVLVYALVGSVITGYFGKRLIGFNFKQEEYEANFRYQSVHVRNNAEAIAFYSGEDMERKGLMARLGDVVKNYDYLIRWQRNLAFFTQGYDYLVVVVPLLIMAPLFFMDKASFGQIQQANIAFSQILAAMSLFVAQFKEISAFAANVKRIGGFSDELDKPDPSAEPGRPRIERETSETIVVEDLTLQTPNYKLTLVRDLDMVIATGESILIEGPSGSGKSSLLRGIAGLWRSGEGKVSTPDLEDMLFMPQEPYLPIGSLRKQLIYPNENSTATRADLQAVLDEVNLPDLLERAERDHGGLDNEHIVWSNVLSKGERQRVAVARLLLAEPRYAIVDEATSALDPKNEAHVYRILQGSGTTYISVGHRRTLRKFHDRILKLDGKGGYKFMTPEEADAADRAEEEEL